MDAGLLAVLTDAERMLVAETEPGALAALDEDETVALHMRVRRARVKYVGQYRRAAAARVPEQGGREGSPEEHPSAPEGRGVRGGALPGQRPAGRARGGGRRAAEGRTAGAGAVRAVGRRVRREGRRRFRVRVEDTSVTTGPGGDRALRNPASEKRRAGTTASGAPPAGEARLTLTPGAPRGRRVTGGTGTRDPSAGAAGTRPRRTGSR